MEWTEDRIETLRRLWGQGMSASQIADILGGVTRNAVIGKLHRLDRPERIKAPAKPVTAKVARAPRPARLQAARPASMLVETDAPRATFRAEEPGSATFLNLEAHMCRWPIGDPCGDDFSFCGGAIVHGPYCASHSALAYRPKAPTAAQLTQQLKRVLA